MFYDILEMKRKVRFGNTEEELEKCEKLIEKIKEKIRRIWRKTNNVMRCYI